MRYSAVVDEVTLREIYLRGFEHVVRAHRPWALMSAYNKLNGVYTAEDHWLMTEVLAAVAGADVVLGDVNPSGRLAETIPHCLEDNPSHLNFPGRDSVANTGERAGAEVAQLYLRTLPRENEVPFHELRGFAKIWLEAGASERVTLTVTLHDLARWNVAAHQWTTAAGAYTVEIGASSRDVRLTGVIETDGDGWIAPLDEWNTIEEWSTHPLGSEFMAALGAGLPDGADTKAPELVAMARHLPLIKIATFPFGPSADDIMRLVAAVEARRQELIDS